MNLKSDPKLRHHVYNPNFDPNRVRGSLGPSQSTQAHRPKNSGGVSAFVDRLRLARRFEPTAYHWVRQPASARVKFLAGLEASGELTATAVRVQTHASRSK
jgi:hypothetical protein